MPLTSGRSTRGSGPLHSLMARIGASQSERDSAIPECPSVEPLTPEGSGDGCLPWNTDDPRRSESLVISLRNCLRLPLILDSLLRITDEGEPLSEGLRSALGLRSSQEQHWIRSFARSLYRNCDDLYEAAPNPVHQEFDVGCRRSQEELEDGDVGVQGDVGPGSAVEPGYIAEDESGGIALEACGEAHGSDTRPCEVNDELKQSTFQRTGGRDPRPIHIEDVDERGGPASAKFSTAREGDDLGTGVVASGASASLVGTAVVASSPSVIPSIEPMTPERTPSPTSLKGVTLPRQTNDYEQSCLDLLD